MKIQLTCKICSKQFLEIQSRKDAKFCSQECYGMSLKKSWNTTMIKLTCLECQKEFEKDQHYVEVRSKKGQRFFCSTSCSSSFNNKNRAKKRILICAECKKELIVNQSDVRQKFCSQECYFKNDIEGKAKRWAQVGRDNAKKISNSLIDGYATGKIKHAWFGRNHSEKTCEKISQRQKKYYETHDSFFKNKKHSEKTKGIMREKRSLAFVEGRLGKASWVKGTYYSEKMKKDIFYRSGWEKMYYEYLEKNENVSEYFVESLRIPYKYDNDVYTRFYIPDVVVYHVNGIKELIEIKPSWFKEKKENVKKFKVARDYCNNNNLEFKVITEIDLKQLGIFINYSQNNK